MQNYSRLPDDKSARDDVANAIRKTNKKTTGGLYLIRQHYHILTVHEPHTCMHVAHARTLSKLRNIREW